jgi:hypothetical protein
VAAETDVTTIDEDDVRDDTAVEDNPGDIDVDDPELDDLEDTVVDDPELDEDDETTAEELEPEELDELVEEGAAEPVDEDVEDAALEVPPAVAKPTWRQHRAEMKASARRVRRVVRHIDTWSVFKVATLFIACLWGIVVLASLLIWRAAVTSGSVDNTEDFIVDLGFEDFNFDPEQMFESLLSAGAVMAIASIFFVWLLTILFNLICDITGGIRVTMIEQDLADARKRRRRPPTG